MTDLWIGRTLAHYRIESLIGRGGMAIIYRAQDLKLNRPVAIKVLNARADSVAGRARFEREAKTLAQLNHPHIIKIYDYGLTEDGAPYFVMDYMHRGTLNDLLKRHHAFSWRTALKLLLPIADALSYAHSKNIVHRDIKPANILFNDSRAPILSDFGILKDLDLGHSTMPGTGTPAYMAPEQFLGNITHKTDIYALGIVFYELLTGQRPFSGHTISEIQRKHLKTPPPDPRLLVPNLPDSVLHILRRSLAKNPNKRYPNMKAMAVDMRAALREAPVGTTTTWTDLWAGSGGSVGSPPPPPPPPRTVQPATSPPGRTNQTGTTTVTVLQKKSAIPPLALWIGGGLVILLLALCVGVGILWSTLKPASAVVTTPTSVLQDARTISVPPTSLPAEPAPATTEPPPTITPTPTLVVSAGQPIGRIAFELTDNDNMEIYWMPADGSGVPSNLTYTETDEASPSWSPDGRYLAFHSYRNGDNDIYVMDTLTYQVDRLTSSSATDWYPSWSPDGRYIAFYSNRRNDDYDIYVIDLQAGRIQRVIELQGTDAQPTWFPDSRRLVFQRYQNKNWDIFAVDINGSNLVHLIRRPEDDKTPFVSPDGQYIVFAGRTGGQMDIMLYDMRTGAIVNLTNHPADDRDPSFSPDGQFIIFESDRNGSFDLYRMRVDGSDLTQLTSYPGNEMGGAWIIP